jgi:hypothetical protein
MRVYQFRHVGIFLLLPAFLPTSAIILAFEVLRQTNFRCPAAHFTCEYAAIYLAVAQVPLRETKIIAEDFELSKPWQKNLQCTPR